MEKTTQIRIVVTGPESTGKTTIAKQLAEHFNGDYVLEYLREFAEIQPDIRKEEMAVVAREQLKRELECKSQLVFLDTNLVSLKIYHQYYFNENPNWFDQFYEPTNYHFYLLMDTSIPWEYDVQRESEQVRNDLFPLFEQELKALDIPYTKVSSTNNSRLEQAIRAIEDFLKSKPDYHHNLQ